MTPIPFELHLTINDIAGPRLELFKKFCGEHSAKPIIIELGAGQFIHQPMLGKVVFSDSLAAALHEADVLSKRLISERFGLRRLKIEIPADMAPDFADLSPGFRPYFEWHAKVPFQDPERLLELALLHKAHLSRNAISTAQHTRFLTLREYGTKQRFDQQCAGLAAALRDGGWPVLKLESEYCVYDSDVHLDEGWLPQ